MQIYQYTSKLIHHKDVQDWVNEMGSEGWRLHTAEPVFNQFMEGTSPIQVFIVMDKGFAVDDPEEPVDEEAGPHGIEMKNGPS